MESIVQKFILPWKGLLGFAFVIAVVGCIQWGVSAAIRSNTVIARDAQCVLKSFDKESRTLIMKLDCGGAEDSTNDGEFIADYLMKPGPFACVRYSWVYASCKMLESEKPS